MVVFFLIEIKPSLIMNSLIKILVPALAMAACTNPVSQTQTQTAPDENEFYLLLGSYNTPDQETIQLYSFNQENGSFSKVSGTKGVANPTFLCTNADETVVYSVGEYDEPEKANMNALHFNKENGTLELFSTKSNNAGAPCNIILNPEGDYLLCANYWGGSMTYYPLAEDGSLQNPSEIKYEGSGPHANQTQPHAHAVNFTPDDKYVLVNDLGLDCIHVYPLNQRTAYDSIPL